MCVRCVFYEDSLPCPCVVLRDAGVGVLPEGVMENLVERYCMNCFLTCPIFLRVQRQLEAAHRASVSRPAARRPVPRLRSRKGGGRNSAWRTESVQNPTAGSSVPPGR